jgi:hypothetical protein
LSVIIHAPGQRRASEGEKHSKVKGAATPTASAAKPQARQAAAEPAHSPAPGHERPRARRCHHHRQRAGQCRASQAIAPARALPRALQPKARFKQAHQIERRPDHHQRKQRNDHRRLQLKAPAHRLAARPQGQQHARQRQHGQQGTQHESQPFTAQKSRFAPAARGRTPLTI